MGEATKKPAAWKGFLTGSVGAAIGGAAAHPIDLVKVRLQLQGQGKKGVDLNMIGMAKQVHAKEGFIGFTKGVDASICRQLVYSGLRFGLYAQFKRWAEDEQGQTSMLSRIICSVAAGGIGGAGGNPGDIVMVRMQADGTLPPAERRNYKHFPDALRRIIRSEGVVSLYRTGLIPNVNRAMIISCGQLAAYDQAKAVYLGWGAPDNIGTHFAASFTAAFVASAMSNPVDVAKTRLMNQKTQVYTGTVNCMTGIVKTEGPMALYKGFVTTFARQCPYLVVTWVSVEQLNRIVAKW